MGFPRSAAQNFSLSSPDMISLSRIQKIKNNLRLLIGINLWWSALSKLFDGANMLLAARKTGIVSEARQAGVLGMLTL